MYVYLFQFDLQHFLPAPWFFYYCWRSNFLRLGCCEAVDVEAVLSSLFFNFKWFWATEANTSFTLCPSTALVSKKINSGFFLIYSATLSLLMALSCSKSLLFPRTNIGTFYGSLGIDFSKNSDFQVEILSKDYLFVISNTSIHASAPL